MGWIMELSVQQQLARVETLVQAAIDKSGLIGRPMNEETLIQFKYAIKQTIKANYPDPTEVGFKINTEYDFSSNGLSVTIDPPYGLEKVDLEIGFNRLETQGIGNEPIPIDRWKDLWS